MTTDTLRIANADRCSKRNPCKVCGGIEWPCVNLPHDGDTEKTVCGYESNIAGTEGTWLDSFNGWIPLKEISMPSAPDHLQERIIQKFGDICDYGPIKYLESRGYKVFMFDWIKPTEDHVPTDEEMDCIDFLFLEYDWGGIVSKEEAEDYLVVLHVSGESMEVPLSLEDLW